MVRTGGSGESQLPVLAAMPPEVSGGHITSVPPVHPMENQFVI